MATGANGFGLTHGYTDQDEQPDRDNSHEYRGHGVVRGLAALKNYRGPEKGRGAGLEPGGAFRTDIESKAQVKRYKNRWKSAAEKLNAAIAKHGKKK
jgi:hypothetical protein